MKSEIEQRIAESTLELEAVKFFLTGMTDEERLERFVLFMQGIKFAKTQLNMTV